MKSRKIYSSILALMIVFGLLFSNIRAINASAATNALGASDFLKASGPVLKNNSGNGAIVNLRGTNLGGWLMQEGWMSPNGEAALDRSGWTASASSTEPGGSAANALDANLSTRWSSGAAQASGQWFKVDFGGTRAFDEIAINANTSTGDYPGTFNVEVSNDNANWNSIKSATGSTQNVVVHVPDQLKQRYIRISLTGGKGNWFSIHDFNVYVTDDYSTRAKLTSRFGAATAKSLIDVYQDTWIQASDLDNIKNMGMNVVRVPIYWQVLMNTDGSMKPDSEAFRKLDWVVTESSNRGLYVILDYHGSPGAHCPWQSCGQMGSNTQWANATYQNWSVQIWQRIATRYNGNPAVAAYDLLNEPLLSFGEGENAAQVQQKMDFYNRLYTAVRAIDPNHLIMIAAFYSFNQALPPSTYGWTNVMYQTHHYDFNNSNNWGAQNTLIENGINDLTQYQTQWNIPVYAGEFWFHNFNDLYAKWYSALNARNISWTNWAYKNRNPAGNVDSGGTPNATNWGYYLGSTGQVPDINNDSAATIAAKWAGFGTNTFQAQTDFINTAKAYTANFGWSSIKATANNQYASADLNNGGVVYGNRTTVQGWEKFKIINNPDGSVSFQSQANNLYLTADLNNGTKLTALAKGVLGWEKFWRINNADGTVSFQAQANNLYVSADLNNSGIFYANRPSIQGWEKFIIAVAP